MFPLKNRSKADVQNQVLRGRCEYLRKRHEVSFYAFQNGQYSLHRVSDWNDPNVLWYDTEKKAMDNRLNANDCVLFRGFEE